MLLTSKRRFGVYLVAACGLGGLMTSTPGLAVISHSPAVAAQAAVAAPTTDFSSPAFTPVAIEPAEEQEPDTTHVGSGEASFYGNELAGNRTASGERFNPRALTAAHRTLPLGSKLRVTNKSNGKSVIVRINDRGPFTKARLIDVSFAAAQELNLVRAGRGNVRLELLR